MLKYQLHQVRKDNTVRHFFNDDQGTRNLYVDLDLTTHEYVRGTFTKDCDETYEMIKLCMTDHLKMFR